MSHLNQHYTCAARTVYTERKITVTTGVKKRQKRFIFTAFLFLHSATFLLTLDPVASTLIRDARLDSSWGENGNGKDGISDGRALW